MLSGLLTVSLITGCQRFEPRPLDPGLMATELREQNLQAPKLRSYLFDHGLIDGPDEPIPLWSLEQLTFAAYYFHPQLRLSLTDLKVATASKRIAQQRPNPRLITMPAYNSTTTVPSPWILGGNIDYQIETAGKRKIRLAAAAHQESTARHMLAATAWQVRAGVHRAFVSLWEALKVEEATERQAAALGEVHELTTARYQAGEVSLLELSQARINYEQAKIAHLERLNLADSTRVSLAAAIGVSVHALKGMPFDFRLFTNIPPNVPQDSLIDDALTNRADLLATLTDYATAEQNLRLEIARQYPNLTLSPGYNYDQGNNEWRFGVGLELPLLHQNQGQIAVAEAMRQNQAERVRQRQRGILAEIESTLAQYRNARQTAEASAEGLAAAERQENLMRARYQAGEVSRFEVASVSALFATAKITSWQALARLHQALANLEAAIQHPILFSAPPLVSTP